MASLKHRDTTELILKAFYAVYNELGYGFLENVYENAVAIELASLGLNVGPLDGERLESFEKSARLCVHPRPSGFGAGK